MALMGSRAVRMISPIGSDPHHQRAQAGFTLLELLIVILIMAVVVGFSVPRFSRTFSYLQLQVFAYDVAKLLTYASKRAVARGEMLSIHFDVEGGRYWLAHAQEASPEGESERVAGKFGRISSVPEAISLDPSAREVTFYPDGRADRFEMFIFNNRQDGYRLVTNVWTGRVKLLETREK
jgi:prepilin-type N-terminal cleavage/methylation domain-containing protein